MKYIAKDTEPSEFSSWKEKDKMAHRPKWKRVPAQIKRRVHESLIREQGFICCYCECSIDKDASHVEHFRPVSKFRDKQLDYGNLLCSCQRKTSAGEPRHCGRLKDNWFDEKLLVSPMSPDCETRFGFTGNGDIFPRCRFSTAICYPDGRIVAQAEHVPIHVGALPWAAKAVYDHFGDDIHVQLSGSTSPFRSVA